MRPVYFMLSFLAALVATSAIMPLVIRLATRVGAVDRPGGRRVHTGEIPRLGGVGIFFGFIAGVGSTVLFAGKALSVSDPTEYVWYGAIAGTCLLFALGVLDDIFHFRASIKLMAQLAAALMAVWGGVTIDLLNIPLLGTIDLGWLAPVAAVAWILLVTNAINLIDGLDGLAGGVALIVTTTMASVALAMGRFGVVIMALALAGALLGFLRYNFNPARIFMGDGGSQFLGFVLALIAIRGSQKGAAAVAIVVPLLALGLPIMDLATTILRRVRRREPGERLVTTDTVRRITSPDRQHVHHNLLELGWHPRRAVLTLYLIAALFALSGYLSLVQKSGVLAALTLLLSVGAVILIKTVLVNGRARKRGSPARGGAARETYSSSS